MWQLNLTLIFHKQNTTHPILRLKSLHLNRRHGLAKRESWSPIRNSTPRSRNTSLMFAFDRLDTQQQQQQQQTQGSSKALLFLKLCLTNFAFNLCFTCHGAMSVAGGVTPVYPSRGAGRQRRQRRVQEPIVQGPNWGTWKD